MNNLTTLTIRADTITDYSALRNRELAQVKSGWVLFLDADEKLSPALQAEIETVLKKPRFLAYDIPRLDTFMGQELHYGEPGNNRLIRLARHDWGKWRRPVHEVWVGEGRVGHLRHPILHHPHPSLRAFLTKINTYSDLEAKYRFSLGLRSSLFHLTVFPLAKFLVNIFLKLGFRDGLPGLIHASLMSFHSYLTWGKLYLLWRRQ